MFAYSYVKANRNMDTEQKPLTSTFSEMRAKILRFAARFFPSEEDAEDALQEAFCRLWCRHPDICSEAEAEAFAKTTVRSIGILASMSGGGNRRTQQSRWLPTLMQIVSTPNLPTRFSNGSKG